MQLFLFNILLGDGMYTIALEVLKHFFTPALHINKI